MKVIGREDLIRNKTASGRMSDLADLERLGIKATREMLERALQRSDNAED